MTIPTDIVSREKYMTNSGGADRVIYILSLLGNRDVTVNGTLLTRTTGQLPIRISPSFWRHFSCNPDCKAICCIATAAHIDMYEEESAYQALPEFEQERFVHTTMTVNGTLYPIRRSSKSTMGTKPDMSRPMGRYCQFLVPRTDGSGWGCSLHKYGNENKPLICQSCLEWTISDMNCEYVLLSQRRLGREWLYEPTPMCEFTEKDIPSVDEKISAFERLREWAVHFDIPSATPRIDHLLEVFESIRVLGVSPRETLRI